MLVRIAAAVALAAPLAALAVQPNIEAGQWEYTSTTVVEGDFPVPDQTETNIECVTQEDLERGEGFLEETEGCEVASMDLRRDGMTYSMVCEEQGTAVVMDADMRFFGERVEGVIDAEMDTPMGKMVMKTTVEGRRLGACP